MRPEPKTYLRDIADACSWIEAATGSVDSKQFAADRVLRAAVERWFTIVGEAGSRLLRVDPSFDRQLPDLRRAIGFRNVIMHQYDELDPVIVWQATRENVPKLRAEAERLLGSS